MSAATISCLERRPVLLAMQRQQICRQMMSSWHHNVVPISWPYRSMHLAGCVINTISRMLSQLCHKFAAHAYLAIYNNVYTNHPYFIPNMIHVIIMHLHAFFCTSAKSSQVYRNAIGIIAPAGRDSWRGWHLACRSRTMGHARARAWCNYDDAWVCINESESTVRSLTLLPRYWYCGTS